MINIHSKIEGDFEGFDEDKVFKLVNGQVWQQVRFIYRYHYAYSPSVHIYTDNDGRIKMKVEGVLDAVEVRRIE